MNVIMAATTMWALLAWATHTALAFLASTGKNMITAAAHHTTSIGRDVVGAATEGMYTLAVTAWGAAASMTLVTGAAAIVDGLSGLLLGSQRAVATKRASGQWARAHNASPYSYS